MWKREILMVLWYGNFLGVSHMKDGGGNMKMLLDGAGG
jgi:hypothetical protein